MAVGVTPGVWEWASPPQFSCQTKCIPVRAIQRIYSSFRSHFIGKRHHISFTTSTCQLQHSLAFPSTMPLFRPIKASLQRPSVIFEESLEIPLKRWFVFQNVRYGCQSSYRHGKASFFLLLIFIIVRCNFLYITLSFNLSEDSRKWKKTRLSRFRPSGSDLHYSLLFNTLRIR